jgi:RNA polymerase sigma factor (sigma-70 family)
MLQEIIEGCRKGNPAQQRKLFELFAPVMMTVCRRYTSQQVEAYDILQDAFVNVYRSFMQYDDTRGSIEGWIRKIVVNASIQHWKKYHKNMKIVSDEYLVENKVSPEIESSLNEEEILQLINQLSKGYRLVFNLYAIDGYSHAEIADMLNITESTSRSQLARARKILQDAINKMGKIAIHEKL